VSPLPTQMTDHWMVQPGTDPHRRQLMWPITLGAERAAIELAGQAHERLAGIPGLDLVPPRWLHMTTLTRGPADDIAPDGLGGLVEEAQHLLVGIAPVTITLGRVLYHPRAVMLDAGPADPFQPVIDAIQTATRHARRSTGLYHDPWRPHITLAYSNATRPAAPIIEALGRGLPAREVTIRSVSLVAQSPRQRWTWDTIADLSLAAEESQHQ
jgi:2'-5' RNA ligase